MNDKCPPFDILPPKEILPENKATINQIRKTGQAISPLYKEALNKMIEKMALKGYSGSTIRTYKNEFSLLLQLLGTKPVSELNADEVKRYILYCIHESRLSENIVHSRLNALKFYCEQVLNKEKYL